MRYHVYLEEDETGRCMAHVPDLAGCTATGPDRAAALAALPAAIRAYLRWCGEHGEPLPTDEPVEVAVAEVVRGCRPWRRGGAHALFSVDRAPLGDAELRAYLRRMSYARGDLLALVRGLSPHTLDASPPGLPSVRAVLAHLIETEAWYLSRLGQRIPAVYDGTDIVQRLVDSRARAVEVILRLSPRQRDLVYVPTENPSDNPEEGWTLRKVLRCCLEHELSHLQELQARFSDSLPERHELG
jgi:predicted RNase H-like HicB family nuclease